MKLVFLVAMTLLLAGAGCAGARTGSEHGSRQPVWVETLIDQFQRAPVGNPPQSIWRYEYHERVVYFVPAQCCDQYSQLYDANGTLLCAPDGGFGGSGDGRCPDFFTVRRNESLVWKDPRR